MAKILWADDEIDLLKPHILFLNEKNHEVQTAHNGYDAIEACKNDRFDIVFLDENMPGITGLETLQEIKNIYPEVPVVMITKSEEEMLMESAIGSKIADYLIKPVNPKQILSSLTKLLYSRELVSEKTTSAYRQEFGNISAQLSPNLSHQEWTDLYKKLVYWEMELKASDKSMHEIFAMQKSDANGLFAKFIEKNYANWFAADNKDVPLLSHKMMRQRVFPLIDDIPTVFILIDNLRYDQYRVIQPMLTQYLKPEVEDTYFAMLPTATQYARNAIFSGLLPLEISKQYPDKWQNDDDEGGKNLHEELFLRDQIARHIRKDIKCGYYKITNNEAGKALADNVRPILDNQFTALVYNFVDMMSHARTEMEMIRELASDEQSYRGITQSWFEHSPLYDIIKKLSEKPVRIIITTDHGTVRVRTPNKVIGDRATTTNLRYKQGKNLNYNPKEVFEVKDPAKVGLPKPNVSSTYIFAKEYDYFVYANNYNHFVNYYADTFQHGGISLEEMIVPFAVFRNK